MDRSYGVFGLLLFVISLNNVHSNIFFTDLALPTSQLNKCTKICNDSYKASEENEIFIAVTTDSDSCSRGCRFFSIAEMLADMDMTVAGEACRGCCDDSYVDSKRQSCNHGCDTMSKLMTEPVVVKSSFSLSIFLDDTDINDEQGPQSAGDNEMDDVLMDPALRNQLSINVIDDSKLPEMKVKTLPIGSSDKVDDLFEADQLTSTTASSTDCLWWLRDFLQMNHIPPCVLAAILVLLIIVLLRFMFTCDVRRNVIASSSFVEDNVNSSLTKSTLSSPSKTMPVAFLFENEKDGFSIVSSDVHKMPPPKYDEAMKNDNSEAEVSVSVKMPSSTQLV